MTHPYRGKSSLAFWSRSVSSEFAAPSLISNSGHLIRRTDKVVSAGSCFASNLVPFLEKSGLNYFKTEYAHGAFAEVSEEPYGYDKFSASYGNIYTVRQLLQLLRRVQGRFRPKERFWITADGFVDPYRPGLRHRASTEEEFDALTAQHLNCVKAAFFSADVFVLTLGLTEAWRSKEDGAVFPACPGTVAGTFDSNHHEFHNFTVEEISADLDIFISEIRENNPSTKFILTVSPVPLVATATDNHVLCASVYSKSVLRVVAEGATARHENVTYFPAYEIVTGPQAPKSYFETDRRNVTQDAVAEVMHALLSHCEVELAPISAPATPPSAASLSEIISSAECEEVMSER